MLSWKNAPSFPYFFFNFSGSKEDFFNFRKRFWEKTFSLRVDWPMRVREGGVGWKSLGLGECAPPTTQRPTTYAHRFTTLSHTHKFNAKFRTNFHLLTFIKLIFWRIIARFLLLQSEIQNIRNRFKPLTTGIERFVQPVLEMACF